VYGGLGGPGGFETGGGGGGFLPGANGNSPNSGDAGGLGGLGGSANGGDGGDGGGGAAADHYNSSANGGNFGFGGISLSTDGGGGGGIGGGGGGGGQNPDTSGDNGLALYGGGGGFGGGGGSHLGLGGFGGGGGAGTSGDAGFGGGDGGDAIVSGGGGGGAGMGGAIFNMSVGSFPSGVLTMTDCTLTENTAQGGNGGDGNSADNFGDAGVAGNGGSAYGAAVFNLNGSVSLADDTLDSNHVRGGVSGMAVNASVFQVDAAADGGAVYNLAYGNNILTGGGTSASVTLFNSILADSTGGVDLVSSAPHTEVSGSTNLVESYNLGMQLNASFITQHASPGLGPLQDNGGLSPTMAILSKSSAAFGTGDKTFAIFSGVNTDQRGPGFARIVGGRLDLGAYEVQPNDSIHPIRPPAGGPGQAWIGLESILVRVLSHQPTGHHVPGRTPFGALTLERGVVHDGSLAGWLDSIVHARASLVAVSAELQQPVAMRLANLDAFFSAPRQTDIGHKHEVRALRHGIREDVQLVDSEGLARMVVPARGA
jgi:hypothetical protein